jgi:hypothetical protein
MSVAIVLVADLLFAVISILSNVAAVRDSTGELI